MTRTFTVGQRLKNAATLGRSGCLLSVLRPFPSRFCVLFLPFRPRSRFIWLYALFSALHYVEMVPLLIWGRDLADLVQTRDFSTERTPRGVFRSFFGSLVGRVQSSDNLGGLAKIQLGELSPSSLALRNVCLSLSSSQSSIPLHFIMNMSSYLPFSTWAKRGEKI